MDNEKITGTCLSMCPEEETKLRQREGLLHRLEVSNSKRHTKKPKYVVKQFSRSAAGQNMQNVKYLRPGPVLIHTVKYLLEEVINSNEVPWHIVYIFITNRLRAVRQDMIIQRVSRSYCVAILQPIVKFHAYASYKLCDQPVTNFDPVLNKQHLIECLKMLLSLYDEFDMFKEEYPNKLLAKVKVGSEIKSYDFDVNFEETRPFMEALYLVLNLGHPDPILRSLTLPEKVRKDIVNKALEMSLFYRKGNWVKVCRIMKGFPPLLAAVSSLHLPEIRKKTIEVMSLAYSSKNLTFPVEILRNILLYNTDDDLFLDLAHYGVSVFENNSIQFLKSNFIKGQNTVSTRKEEFVDKKISEICISSTILYGQKKLGNYSV